MIKKTLAVAVVYGLIWVPLVASSDPVPKSPVLCLQGNPCQQPNPSVPVPSPPPTSTTTPPASAGAIKFQPGWYALFNKTCIPLHGAYGCTAAEIVATVKSEICPNANLVGLKVLGSPLFFMSHTAGVYTATGPDLGFAIFDPVIAALRACGKFLILQAVPTILDSSTSNTQFFYPHYTYPASFAAGGTATGGAYGVTVNTQTSQVGQTANVWQSDWRDLAIAVTQAYCNRYESDPAFYAIGMFYWNVSLPFAGGAYPVAQYNSYYRNYLAAARQACPTTNILVTLDYTDPYPAEFNTYLNSMRTTGAAMANNDVSVNAMSWGQSVYTGATGSPSTDYRGVVRNMEEVESPDMCGTVGHHAPAELFDVMQNGNANNRPRWPNTIVISMATECDAAGTGWAAWKTFIDSKSGRVMNGRDSTLRTTAEVKSRWCESGMTCQ